MWRSNVLRLRKCSSAAAWRNTKRFSSQTSLPITDREFWQAIEGVDPSLTKPVYEDVQRLGFAISGGVDSMALAALLAISPNSEKKSRIQAHAFIVDHKVRPESTEEAEWVAEQCRSKFGMEASVLPLSWPAGFDPLDHKRFETDARTLRYQALGRACRAARIRKLLLAHHADDQAETVLMRLANNRLRSGLQAMQPVEWIPECFGIHGVSHSGGYQDCKPFPIEQGGVRILRPLLGFEKSRLIATCEQHGVAWAEDKTNHMQTYTSRNAIRHVLKHHELPAALNVRSLVDMSLRMQDRIKRHKDRAKQLLRICPKHLDLQTGSLSIRFPKFQQLFCGKSSSAPTQSQLNAAKNVAYCLLEQVGQLISPRETAPLGEMAATVGNIWPEFLQLEEADSPLAEFSGNKTDYCVYSIWWRKLPVTKSPPTFSSPKSEVHDFAQQYVWLLTRQPLNHRRPGPTSSPVQYPPSYVLPLTQNATSTSTSMTRNSYQFFDGRWWINIRNRSTDTLTLRIFTKEDFDRIPSLHSTKRDHSRPERFIATALSLLKPADQRFALPAVFRRDPVTNEETLIGFPTLNVSMGQLGYPNDVCSWRVRYKKVDLEDAMPSRDIAPGITHATIEKELAKFDRIAKRSAQTDSQPSSKTTRTQKPVSVQRGNGRPGNAKSGNDSSRPERRDALIPTAESHRHGRSGKRDGGGYDIKWEDDKDRMA